ncbi:MAG: TonB-dependent receptor [Salinivirgaceae bacterium]
MTIRFFVFLIVSFLSASGFGQIKGKVLDAQDLHPLPNVHVIHKTRQTITNDSGYFELAVQSGYLKLMHLGYVTQEVKVSYLHAEPVILMVPVSLLLESITVGSELLRHEVFYSPASIGIIQQSRLEQSAGITFVEHLNTVPGVFVSQGAINTNIITIRGMGSRNPYGTNRIKAYYKGIPITSGDGTTEIEDFNITDIQRIEVLKGAKSAFYGSGMGGVILLSGNKPASEGFVIRFSLEAGWFNAYKPELLLQFKQQNWNFQMNYGYTTTDGWRQNSMYQRNNLNFDGTYSGKNTAIDLIFHFIDADAQIASSLNERTFTHSPDSAAANWLAINGFENYRKTLLGLRHKYRFSKTIENELVVFGNLYKGYESRPFNILVDDSKKMGIRETATLNFDRTAIHAGFELLKEQYAWSIFESISGNKGEELNRFQEIRMPLSMFFQSSYTFSTGTMLEFGLSYNYLNYALRKLLPDSLDQKENFRYQPVLSPFLGFSFPIKKNAVVYVSTGHGFSAPSVEETLMPEGEINPDLKPESGYNTELGFRWKAWQSKLYVDAALYYLWATNLLVTERISESVFFGKNAGSTRHAGLELSVALKLNQSKANRMPAVDFNASYSFARHQFKNYTDNGVVLNGNYLAGIPRHQLWASLELQFKKNWYTQVNFQWIGSRYLTDKNTEKNGSYQVTHLRIGQEFNGFMQSKINWSIGINNLFNQAYASMILINAPSINGQLPRYYYPGTPVNMYGRVSFSF